MSQLEKAKLQEIDKNDQPKGEADVVQFNPSSLKLKLTNSIEGGQSRGKQRRQQNAKSSTVLTVELIFDSADEDNNNQDNRDKPCFLIVRFLLVGHLAVPWAIIGSDDQCVCLVTESGSGQRLLAGREGEETEGERRWCQVTVPLMWRSRTGRA